MTKRKGGVDRSFFDDMLNDVEEVTTPAPVTDVPLASVQPRTAQFRRVFDEEAIAALAASIEEVGLLEPVVVREVGNKLEIVAGERRYRALTLLGHDRIPVRVVTMDDAKAELAGAIENLNRENLTPLEEVDAVLSVLGHAFNMSRDGIISRITRVRSVELGDAKLPQEEVAPLVEMFKRLGYTSVNSFYANRLSLLRFPNDVLEAMRAGLAYTKARVLARVRDDQTRKSLLAEALDKGLSVEVLEFKTRKVDTDVVTDDLFGNFDRVRRFVTRSRLRKLDAPEQKKLQRLLNDLEKLLADKV